jgi:hypothetical protein
MPRLRNAAPTAPRVVAAGVGEVALGRAVVEPEARGIAHAGCRDGVAHEDDVPTGA